MFQAEKIAALEARIKSLEADLQTATDGQAGLKAELDQAKADLAKAQSEVTDLKGKVTAAEQRATEAEARATAAEAKATAAEASITDQVNTRLAAAGVDPIARDPQAKNPDEPGTKASTNLPPMKAAAAAMEGAFKLFKR